MGCKSPFQVVYGVIYPHCGVHLLSFVARNPYRRMNVRSKYSVLRTRASYNSNNTPHDRTLRTQELLVQDSWPDQTLEFRLCDQFNYVTISKWDLTRKGIWWGSQPNTWLCHHAAPWLGSLANRHLAWLTFPWLGQGQTRDESSDEDRTADSPGVFHSGKTARSWVSNGTTSQFSASKGLRGTTVQQSSQSTCQALRDSNRIGSMFIYFWRYLERLHFREPNAPYKMVQLVAYDRYSYDSLANQLAGRLSTLKAGREM